MRNKFTDLHAHYFGRKSTFGGILMLLGLSPAPRTFIKSYWNIPYPRPRNVQPISTVKALKGIAKHYGKPENQYLYLLEGQHQENPDSPDSPTSSDA